MNRFYRKPKPETMKKNREIAKEQFPDEMKWLKENVSLLTLSFNQTISSLKAVS